MIRAAVSVLMLTCLPLQARDIQGGAMIEGGHVLAGDAVLVVEVHGRDGLAAEGTFPAAGRQAPLPFRLEGIPDAPALIRAAIREGGTVTWLSEPMEIGAGAEPVDLRILPLQPHVSGGFAATLACGSRFLRLGFAGADAVLSMGSEGRKLAPAIAASGARFSDGAAAETSVWSRALVATVVWAGEALPQCRMVTMPEQAGVTARGNEPGWRLDLSQDGLRLTTEMGLLQEAGALPPAFLRADAITYLVPGGMVATLLPGPCADTMTGMPYPLTAAVDVLDPPGPSLTGCAGDPLDLLQGDWTVLEAGGTEVPADHGVTLEIRGDRVAGRGGCNRYTGGLSLTGEGMAVGPVASTRMACAPDRMATEDEFLRALQRVDRFDLRDDGLLVLISGDRPAIVARQ